MASKSFADELPNYLRQFAANTAVSGQTLGATGNLQWPIGLGYDYMQIDIVEFVKTTELQFQATGATQTSGTEGAEAKEGESGIQYSGISTGTSYLSNIQAQKTNTNADKIATVILPVPNNLNYSDSPQYKEGSGVVGKILPSIAKGIINQESAAGIAKDVQALACGGKIGLAMKALDSVLGQGGAAQVTQNGFGKIMNPYTEQVFNGVTMRTFSFDWKLVPRNSSETANIKQIIKTLRAYALPDYASTLGLKENSEAGDSGNLSDRWLTVPKIFRIGWRNGDDNTEITSLPRIKPCVLTSVSINYTPDAVWATYVGADPVAYNMTLNFTETEIITSTEVLLENY